MTQTNNPALVSDETAALWQAFVDGCEGAVCCGDTATWECREVAVLLVDRAARVERERVLRELLRRVANGETVAVATLWAASRGEPVNLGESDKGD